MRYEWIFGVHHYTPKFHFDLSIALWVVLVTIFKAELFKKSEPNSTESENSPGGDDLGFRSKAKKN